ncbi:hypothetical protein ACUOA5_51980, partial [Escherichia coli]
MELATTQSVLMQIQPTIQRFARMLASVLQLEVEIVDENFPYAPVPATRHKF